jgi:hypothetical protein
MAVFSILASREVSRMFQGEREDRQKPWARVYSFWWGRTRPFCEALGEGPEGRARREAGRAGAGMAEPPRYHVLPKEPRHTHGPNAVHWRERHVPHVQHQRALEDKARPVRRLRQPVEEPLHRVVLQQLLEGPLRRTRVVLEPRLHGGFEVLDGHGIASR